MTLHEEIKKTEKEIKDSKSEYRRKDLIKYLIRLKRKAKKYEKSV